MRITTSPKPCIGLIIFISFLLLTSVESVAQNEVAIGSGTTKSNAILWLNGNGSQGLILPVVTNKSAVITPDKGMVVYDDSDNKVWYRSNSAWVEVGSGTGASTANLNLLLQGNQLQLRDGTTVLNSANIASGTQANGSFLVFNGGSWQYATLSGDVTGANGALQVNGLKGKTIATLPATTQALVYDPSANSGAGGWSFQALTTGATVPILTNGQLITGNGTTNTATTITGDATLSGGTLTISNNAITTTKINANAIDATKLADNAVTTAKISDATITGADIAASTITADKLAQSSATTGQILKWNGTNWVPQNETTGTSTLLSNGQILTGNGTANSATTLSGDATLVGGVVTISSNAITTAKINANAVDATKLADNAVTSVKISDASITGADIANTTITGANIAATTITTDKLAQSTATSGQVLKWNGTNWVPAADDAGVGATPTLSSGQILTGNGTTNSAIALTGDATLAGGVITIGNNAITTAKINAAAVDATKLADNSVTSLKVADNAITTTKINAAAVDGTKLADNAVTSIKITDATVTGADIAATTITGSNIANTTITGANIAAATIAGSNIANTTITGANIAATTITADKLAQSAATSGQVLKWNGTNWVPAADDAGVGATPTLSSGQILTGDGATNTATALSGDATLAGGVITIGNNAITTAKINAAAVDATKLADNSVITLKVADNAITTTKINAAAVDGTKLADNAVTSIKITDATVTGADIAATTITGSNIANTTITGANIAATTITADKLAQSAATSGQVLKWNGTNWVPAADDAGVGATPTLNSGQILTGDGATNSATVLSGDATLTGGVITITNNAITTAKISASAVDGAKLADNAVTSLKITDASVTGADIAASTIAGSNIANTTITGANIAATTITADKLAQSAATSGQVLKWNGTNWVPAADDAGVGATPTLSSGQILTGDGATNTATALSGDATLTGGVITITNNAITTAKISASAVDGTKLADNAVTSLKITDATVTGADIAATTITGTNIAAATIAGSNIANTTITGANIAATTITADKLAQSTATSGQVLQWNGSAWVPATLTAGGDMSKATYDTDANNIVDVAATVTTNANLTGPVTSVGNATSIGAGAITNAMLVNGAVANLSGINTGDQINITGNAATVTTNANLTGPVTSTGNATAIANGVITNAMLANGAVANLSGANTGDEVVFSSGADGLVPAPGASTGRVLRDDGTWVIPSGAGDMLKSTYDANNNGTVDLATTVTTNANLTGPVTSTGNATAIASGVITNAMLANPAVANLSGTNTGDQINITGNAATVTTNANLTGPVTSTGNATAIANGAITNAMLANGAVANLSGTNTGDEVTFTGAGTSGIVPDPGSATGKVLRDDGTWVIPSGAGDMLKSTYDANNNGTVDLATTVTTNANLTGPVTSTGNATAIASGVITNAMLANPAVANLSGTNTGDQINITGNAATVTTNANLTGPVTSVGNATSIGAAAITNAMLGTINTAGKVNGGAITTGTIGGNTVINTTGTINSGAITATSFTGDGSGLTNLPAGVESDPTVKVILGIVKSNGTTITAALAGTDYQSPITLSTTGTSGAATLVGNTLNVPNYTGTTYTAGTGLTLATNTFSVNASQNISTLSNLTANGLIKTSGGTGALSIATSGTDYLAPNGSGSALTNLNASNITSGTLPITNGGTGATTVAGAQVNLGILPNTLISGNIFVGSAGNVATPVALSGDATITNLGALTIANGAISGGTAGKITDLSITDADISNTAAIAGTKVAPVFGNQGVSTTSTLTTGTAGQFAVDATGNITKLNNVTTSFPSAQGATGTVLTNNGLGVLTWAAAASGWGLTGNALADATSFLGTTTAQPLRFSTGVGGVERMRIDESGNVGIGTTSPTARLHIQGPGNFDIANTEGDFKVGTGTHRFKVGVAYAGGGAGDVYMGAQGGTSRLFIGGGNTLSDFQTLTVGGGNVGIGTTGPLVKLSVRGRAYIWGNGSAGTSDGDVFAPTIDLSIDDNDTGFEVPADGQLAMYTNNVERIRISNGGNVGIGTTTPTTAKLVINTSAGATGLDLASADSYAELRVLRNSLSTGDKDMYFGYLSGATSSLHMYSNNSETMTVKAGNVGIGTATPTEKLHVTGNAYASVGLAAGGDIRVDGLDLNDGTYERTFRFGSGATGEAIGSKRTAGGNQYGIDFYTGYANRMAITSGGNVGIGTSAPQTSLDVNGSLRSTNGYITLTGEGTNAQGNVGVGFGGYNNVKLAVNADQQFGIYVQGATSYAGYFVGNVDVTGTLNAGVKNFKIDHPLDPENKYLQHVSIESPDMMNIYNGNIVTDVQGIATVTLPSYFEVLNRDFRYQLTVIGQFAQAIIDKEISGNQFVIKTDKPNTKVSWQVTGIRQDPFAEKNRVIPEVEKSGSERGKYIHPEAYGLSRERGIRPDKNNEIVMPSENKTGNKKQD